MSATICRVAHASCVLVSASRRNDLNELATCKEKSAMARTLSPARETRALPNRVICLR
jgi:hypothetical protein